MPRAASWKTAGDHAPGLQRGVSAILRARLFQHLLRSGLWRPGMPITLGPPPMEMQISANVAWSMYPGLSHGAYSACRHMVLKNCASVTRRNWYRAVDRHHVPTEPQCGTDLGPDRPALSTTAMAATTSPAPRFSLPPASTIWRKHPGTWCHGRIRQRHRGARRCSWCRNGIPDAAGNPAHATPSALACWNTRWASTRATPPR